MTKSALPKSSPLKMMAISAFVRTLLSTKKDSIFSNSYEKPELGKRGRPLNVRINRE